MRYNPLMVSEDGLMERKTRYNVFGYEFQASENISKYDFVVLENDKIRSFIQFQDDPKNIIGVATEDGVIDEYVNVIQEGICEYPLNTLDNSEVGEYYYFNAQGQMSTNKEYLELFKQINESQVRLTLTDSWTKIYSDQSLNFSPSFYNEIDDGISSSYNYAKIDYNPKNNNLYIIYTSIPGYSLRFAKSIDDGENWTSTIIDNIGSDSKDILVDSNGKIYVAYMIDDILKLAYSTDDGDTWTKVDIDDGGTEGYITGYACEMAFDSNENLHIAYVDENNYLNYGYSTDEGETWTTMIVSGSNVVKNYNVGTISIDVNKNENAVWIAYNNEDDDLYIAQSDDFGITWNNHTIDTDLAPNTGVSIAINNNDGKIWVFYVLKAGPYYPMRAVSENVYNSWDVDDVNLINGVSASLAGYYSNAIIDKNRNIIYNINFYTGATDTHQIFISYNNKSSFYWTGISGGISYNIGRYDSIINYNKNKVFIIFINSQNKIFLNIVSDTKYIEIKQRNGELFLKGQLTDINNDSFEIPESFLISDSYNILRNVKSSYFSLSEVVWNASYSTVAASLPTVAYYNNIEINSFTNDVYIITQYGTSPPYLGFKKSTDGGSTWSPITNLYPTASEARIKFNQYSSEIYVFMGINNVDSIRFLKSNNGGTSWTNVKFISGTSSTAYLYFDTEINQNDGSIWISWIDSTANELYISYSKDFGETWTTTLLDESDTDYDLMSTGTGIAIDSRDNSIWISYVKKGPVSWTSDIRDQIHIAKSFDGGSTWETYQVQENLYTITNCDMAIDPNNGNKYIVFGTNSGQELNLLFISGEKSNARRWKESIITTNIVGTWSSTFKPRIDINPNNGLICIAHKNDAGELYASYSYNASNIFIHALLKPSDIGEYLDVKINPNNNNIFIIYLDSKFGYNVRLAKLDYTETIDSFKIGKNRIITFNDSSDVAEINTIVNF